MKRLSALVALCGLLFLSAGCFTTLESTVSPDANLGKDRKYYVAHNEKDRGAFEGIIQAELARWGRSVSSGPRAEMPPETDLLVTYSDKWNWDLTVYLQSLDVFFLDPFTEAVVAKGRSMRTSLARRSAEEMTAEVFTEIFSKVGEAPPEAASPPQP